MIEPLRKPLSRALEKSERKQAAKTLQRKVYGVVTARDKRRCRACGKEADPSALDMIRRGHHHHVRFRSAGGNDSTANLCLLDAACHADVHAHRMTITGNADSTLVISTEKGTWESPVP